MTRLGEILAGWAMVAGTCAIAAIAFPSISAKAAAQKDAARWDARAQAFGAEAASFVSDISPATATLTDVFMQSDHNIFARDNRLLFDGKASTPAIVNWSDRQAQTHQCLSEAIYYEARSERKAGQKAVAEVILNRVKSKHYPNTICGVVYQGAERRTGCQFTFTCDGALEKTPYGKLWERSQDVARLALTGALPSLTDGATHYHTTDVSPHWAPNMRPTRLIGSHQFYRFRFRERPDASAAATVVAPPPI